MLELQLEDSIRQACSIWPARAPGGARSPWESTPLSDRRRGAEAVLHPARDLRLLHWSLFAAPLVLRSRPPFVRWWFVQPRQHTETGRKTNPGNTSNGSRHPSTRNKNTETAAPAVALFWTRLRPASRFGPRSTTVPRGRAENAGSD